MERSTSFNGKIHYFDWAIFNSYVKLPEGINYIFVHLIDGNINIPSARFPYVRFARFSTWLSQWPYISCGKRGTSNVKMCQNCFECRLCFETNRRFTCVLRQFWKEHKFKFKTSNFGLFVHFSSNFFFFSKGKHSLRGSFSTKNFSIFVDFSNRLGSFFFLWGVCRCGTVRMLLQFGSF